MLVSTLNSAQGNNNCKSRWLMSFESKASFDAEESIFPEGIRGKGQMWNGKTLHYTSHQNDMPKYRETPCAGIKRKPSISVLEMSIPNSRVKPAAISRTPETQQWTPGWETARARAGSKNALRQTRHFQRLQERRLHWSESSVQIITRDQSHSSHDFLHKWSQTVVMNWRRPRVEVATSSSHHAESTQVPWGARVLTQLKARGGSWCPQRQSPPSSGTPLMPVLSPASANLNPKQWKTYCSISMSQTVSWRMKNSVDSTLKALFKDSI